jgi:hypothetical protein
MPLEMTDRVAAGAAFLDEHDPDWWRADVERAIDLDTLALADPASCILGQRCPLEVLSNYADGNYAPGSWRAYFAYAHALSGIDMWDDVSDWAAPLGFISSSHDDDSEEYFSLTAEWKRVITARREVASRA